MTTDLAGSVANTIGELLAVLEKAVGANVAVNKMTEDGRTWFSVFIHDGPDCFYANAPAPAQALTRALGKRAADRIALDADVGVGS